MGCQGRCACCKGACCYDDEGAWACGQMTCQECEDDLDGYWHGPNTSCDDVDCETACCCVPVGDGCNSHQWRLNAAACARLGGTVVTCSDDPNGPREGNANCDGGTPTTVTLTISGVTTGNTAYDDMVDAINAAHVIDLTCQGTGQITLPGLPGNQQVTVTAGVTGRSAGSVTASDRILAPFQLLFLHTAGAGFDLTFIDFTACGGSLFDCSAYADDLGAITSTITGGSPLDFSAATFELG